MKLEQKIHLGSHFLITFIIAINYYRIIQGWLGFVGSVLIMFFGWLIDVDHFIGNKKRCHQVWQNFKNGKISIGDPAPERVNYFHTWKMLPYTFFLIGIFSIFGQSLLAASIFLSYFIHIFVIDVLDYENQVMPKSNPLPTEVHFWLWKHSWFKKICFNKLK